MKFSGFVALTAAALALSVLSPVAAQSSSCAGFESGSGTSADPYLISTAANLAALGSCVSQGAYFLQNADIQLGGIATPWTPVGTSASPFVGNFDGGNFWINGLYVSVPTLAGLFGKISNSTVENVRIFGTVISTNSRAGLLVGESAGSTISEVVVQGTVTARDTVGALVGMTAGSRNLISEILANGVVTSNQGNAGGLIGQVEFQSATIEDVFVRGTVHSIAGQMSGGVVGYGISPIIRRVISIASVSGGANHRGGVIAAMVNTSVLENSFHLDTEVTPLNSAYSTSRTVSQLKDLATFAQYQLGLTADSATTWRIVSGVNENYPFLAFTALVGVPVVVVLPIAAPYVGPILYASATKVSARPGESVKLTGERLSGVTKILINGGELSILELSESSIQVLIPLGMNPGFFDLVVFSPQGQLTVQQAIRILNVSADGASSQVSSSVRDLGSNRIKAYVLNPVGQGKVQILLNGKEIAWVNASSESDKKLFKGYLVRTLKLVSGENLIEVLVNGKTYKEYQFDS